MNTLFLKIKKLIKSIISSVTKTERAEDVLDIDVLWKKIKDNPDKLYYTVTEKPFKVIVQNDYFNVLRIDEDREFIVNQSLEKRNLARALLMKPTCLKDIDKKVRGASYCYAIIKEYEKDCD